jgi:hypothetical protein
MSFSKFATSHDPQGREDYTWPFRLNTGESIASATIDVVDSNSESVDASTDLDIETIAHGQISGTLWGVTAWISGGSAPVGGAKTYYLRCRIETDASPSRKADRTAQLVCKQL